MTAIALGTAAILAAADWVAVARRCKPLEYACSVVVIWLMVAAAAGSGDAAAADGAGLFLLSGGLIAISRFVRPVAWAPLAIIVTYPLAQGLAVVSLP